MAPMNTDPSERFDNLPVDYATAFAAAIKPALESDSFIVCIGNRAYFNFGPKEKVTKQINRPQGHKQNT